MITWVTIIGLRVAEVMVVWEAEAVLFVIIDAEVVAVDTGQ